MLKPKYIIISSASAFIFTIIISLLSTRNFGLSFLRGIIFAIVFGLLAVLVCIVKSKFLDVDEPSLDIEAIKNLKKNEKTGSVVDIVLDEENLTEEKDPLEFKIDDSKSKPIDSVALQESQIEDEHDVDLTQKFTSKADENVKKLQGKMENVDIEQFTTESSNDSSSIPENFNENSASITSESSTSIAAEENTFQPINLAKESYSTKKDPEVSNPSPVIGSQKTSVSNTSTGLDDLPDLGGITLNDKGSNDSVVDTSEFAQASESEIDFSKPKVSEEQLTNNSDTGTIASAIRTLLNS